MQALREEWPELVEKCLVLQPALKRDLRDSWPLEVSDTTLVVGFDPEFSGVMEEVKLLDHGGLHHLFSKRLGRSIRIEYRIMKESVTWSHHSPEAQVETADDKPFSVENAGNDPEEWIKNESIRHVLEVFHGDIIDIQR
ncbi:MAG: hypothetical protein ACO3N7_09045 [Kiritimatiellia bacterium]